MEGKKYCGVYYGVSYTKHRDEVRNLLNTVQKRSKVRTIGMRTIDNLMTAIHNVFLSVPHKNRDGIIIRFNPHARHFPGSYAYTPYGTAVEVRWKAGEWRIWSIERVNSYRYSGQSFDIYGIEQNQTFERYINMEYIWARDEA